MVEPNILLKNRRTFYINSNINVKRQKNFLIKNSQSILKRKPNKLLVVIRKI